MAPDGLILRRRLRRSDRAHFDAAAVALAGLGQE